MDKLKEMVKDVGLYTEESNQQLKGNSCNVSSWAIFRLWINKSGKLTVKTRGVQKSFDQWDDKDKFREILAGFEII